MLADPSRAPCAGAHDFGYPAGGIAVCARSTTRSENDPGGYGHLLLELRAYVCGTRVGEVVVESGEVATAISS